MGLLESGCRRRLTTAPLLRSARWALQAILALADTAHHVRWDGDMRHLPSVGAVIAPPDTHPYLVVKQDNNGTTFVISDIEIPGLTGAVERSTHTDRRTVGA